MLNSQEAYNPKLVMMTAIVKIINHENKTDTNNDNYYYYTDYDRPQLRKISPHLNKQKTNYVT